MARMIVAGAAVRIIGIVMTIFKECVGVSLRNIDQSVKLAHETLSVNIFIWKIEEGVGKEEVRL